MPSRNVPRPKPGSRNTVVLRDELAETEITARAFIYRQKVFPLADHIDAPAQLMIVGMLAPVIDELELVS